MKITRPTALTAATLAVVAVSACSASVVAKQAEPKLALRDAATWLATAQNVTADISLTGSAADWSMLAADVDAQYPTATGATDKDDASTRVMDAVLTAHVRISIDRGADGKPNTADDTTSLLVRAGDEDLLDVFSTTKTVYLKGDAAAIASLVGQPQDAASLTDIATSVDSLVPGAGALVRGRWVSLALADVTKAANEYQSAIGKSGRSGASDLVGDPAQLAAKVRAAVSSALEDVSVATDPTDPSHLVVNGNARAMVTALTKVLPAKALGEVPDLSKLPTSVDVDAFVTDGKLHELRIGVNQFSTVKAGPVGVRLTLSEVPAVTRPTGATPLDLSKAQSLVQPPPTAGLG